MLSSNKALNYYYYYHTYRCWYHTVTLTDKLSAITLYYRYLLQAILIADKRKLNLRYVCIFHESSNCTYVIRGVRFFSEALRLMYELASSLQSKLFPKIWYITLMQAAI